MLKTDIDSRYYAKVEVKRITNEDIVLKASEAIIC